MLKHHNMNNHHNILLSICLLQSTNSVVNNWQRSFTLATNALTNHSCETIVAQRR